MTEQTYLQSIIDFKDCTGKSKRITYNGPIHAANVIITDLYPGCTGKQGSTIFIPESNPPVTKGLYTVIDTTTGSIELECSEINKEDFIDERYNTGRVGYSE